MKQKVKELINETLESFRAQLSKQVERARKSSANFRFAEKYGQVIVCEQPIVFYFEIIKA